MVARSAPRAFTLVLVFFAAIVTVFLMSSTAAHADATAPVTISVSDTSGAPIVGATVTVTGDNISDTTQTTDSTGKTKFDLAYGKSVQYTFTVDATGTSVGNVTFADNPRTVSLNSSLGATVKFTAGAAGAASTSTSSASAAASSSAAAASSTSDDTSTTTSTGGSSGLNLFLGKTLTGLIFGLILALASIGVSLIYGTTGLNNFAQGEMTTLGGFASLFLVTNLGLSSLGTISQWLGLLFAAIIGAAFGWFQDFAIWKPLRRRRVGIIQAMVVSIGLSILLRYMFAFFWGSDRKLPVQDLDPIFSVFDLPITFWDLWGSIICIILLLATAYMLSFTRIGKAMRAVSDNKALASASGIDVDKTIRFVWVLAGLLAAVSGVLLSYYQTIYFMSGAQILLMVFAAVTLGGLGTALGGLIGSLIISVVIELSTYIIPTDMKLVTAMVVMIVILLVRPQGILGKKQRVG